MTKQDRWCLCLYYNGQELNVCIKIWFSETFLFIQYFIIYTTFPLTQFFFFFFQRNPWCYFAQKHRSLPNDGTNQEVYIIPSSFTLFNFVSEQSCFLY